MNFMKVMVFLTLILFSVISAAASTSNGTQLTPIDYFSKGSQYYSIKLSPNGTYLAGMAKKEGKNVLFILDTKTFSLQHGVNFAGNAQVGDFYWVNDKRVVMTKQYLRGWKDHPEYYGELYGVNADGSRSKYLVGYKGEQQTGSRLKKATALYGTSFVLDPLPDDDKRMLIVTYPWSGSTEPYSVVYEVDVYRGHRKKVTRSPSRMAQFLTDNQGRVRVSVSTDDYVNQKIHYRNLDTGFWENAPINSLELRDIQLHAFTRDDDAIYVSASKSGEAKGLYKLHLDSSKHELISQDSNVSPSKVWVDQVFKSVFAVEYESQYPTYEFVDKDATNSKLLKGLLAALPGRQVRITSSTRDGKLNIVWAGSDRHPGNYFMLDATKNNLQQLFASKPWINGDLMSESKPIQFKARDGQSLFGYFTVPEGKELKNLPLVVMPHGGPHGPRDWWQFDPHVQLLASRGIAVLQINFRGSGGFGSNFETAGHRKWGSEIQYDIIDGVKFVIKQGWVNKDNMCIMGASFGAYSALQSSIIEPDMFQCAVGVVGVYDLPMMFEEGDVAGRRTGQRYLKRVLGEDSEQLKAFSPSYNIDKLKAPVLVVHGGEDQRAPIEQAESLIAALKKEEHTYEYLLLEDEGHGFYNEEHQLQYYKRTMDFLKKHLEL